LDGLYLFVKYYQGSFIYIYKTQYSLLHCICKNKSQFERKCSGVTNIVFYKYK